MSCIGCNQAITIQKANDEYILQLAKSMAKEYGKSIGIFRDIEGQLCISTGGDPVQGLITPLMP